MFTTNNFNLSFVSFFFLVVIVIIPSSFSLSFNFSTISPNNAQFINCTGNTTIRSERIQVTPDDTPNASMGRVTYTDPLHLWDRASGNLSDFTTRFSFVIDARGNYSYSDGLAFFLAPVGSNIQPWSGGQSLGIGNGIQSSLYPFVAVEFDTYRDGYDPIGFALHLGIDINSMISVNTTPWYNNVTAGIRNNAWISYNSSSMMLIADCTGFWNDTGFTHSIVTYVVDLRQYLPEYVTFGFSAATGYAFETHNILSWQFSSTNLVTNNVTTSEDRTGLIVGLSVALPSVIFGVALAIFCFRKNKQKKGPVDEEEDPMDLDMDMEFEKGSGAKKFSYMELVLATKNFAEEEKLGEGGFGGVYRGFLRELDSYVAVKRVSRGSKQGLKEYASEVKIISQLRHRNLVQLLGWCHERGELLLVYELMPNGSLDSHLFKSRSVLGWEVRYKIAQGLASALLYFHEGWEHCVLHRDIKSSNIMLDSSFHVKLGDFGLARLVDHEKGSQTTILAGTIGYMAPECAITGQATKESDMYSFGIVLLEIACGRRPTELRYQENKNRVFVLLEWVWSLYGNGKLTDAADPNLSNEFNEREIEQLMIVGLWCAHPDSNQRPSIRNAILVLNFEAHVPTLPRALPMPTYLGPTTLNSTECSSNSGAVDLNKFNNYSGSSQTT